jgi:hypothetical protein
LEGFLEGFVVPYIVFMFVHPKDKFVIERYNEQWKQLTITTYSMEQNPTSEA